MNKFESAFKYDMYVIWCSFCKVIHTANNLASLWNENKYDTQQIW